MNFFKVLFAVVIVVAFMITVEGAINKNVEKDKENKPPNILLLLTDDQDVMVGGMAHMPKLERLLQHRGVTFENAFVHTPICCPSRSSILSGRYLHNGGALDNSVEGNCNGEDWQKNAELLTMATLLQNYSGYRTSFAGKYLNNYGIPGSPGCRMDKQGNRSAGCKRVPPGWDRWLGLIGNSQYYNYGVVQSKDGKNTSGEEVRHGDDYGKDYLPDLVANWTLDSIAAFAQDDDDRPFLAVAAWPTAHMPFTPAPWAPSTFDQDVSVMKTPNYNASAESLQSKHWMMRGLAPIDEEVTEKWMNSVYQNRTEALLSVDNHIEQFVEALQKFGLYDNTWIIYTSDNGWQLGQHRLSYDKRQLYENDIRVPFIVTGPGVPANVTSSAIVLNVDIAPSMVDMAMSSSSSSSKLTKKKYRTSYQTANNRILQDVVEQMDGASFLPTIFTPPQQFFGRSHHSPKPEGRPMTTAANKMRTDFLVSYHGRGNAQCDNFWECPAPKPPNDPDYHMGDWKNNTYHCVRTIVISSDGGDDKRESENSIYCRFTDDENFVEYYNITEDPWQLQNAYSSLRKEQRIYYERRLNELRVCQGPSCRTSPLGGSQDDLEMVRS